MTDLKNLPGSASVEQGLRDLEGGVTTTPEALLLATASTRLRRLGLAIPQISLPRDAELLLYAALTEKHRAPYYRYNALRRELDSFMAALGARQSRERRSAN